MGASEATGIDQYKISDPGSRGILSIPIEQSTRTVFCDSAGLSELEPILALESRHQSKRELGTVFGGSGVNLVHDGGEGELEPSKSSDRSGL